MSRKYTTESFIERLRQINPKIIVTGEYKKSSCGIDCKCAECGFEWSPTPNKLLARRGCPKCAKMRRGVHKQSNQFVEELKHKNPTVTLVGDYISGHTKTCFRCNVCGNEWDAVPYSVLAGHGCPKCYHASTSFAEQFIYEALASLFDSGVVKNRYRFHKKEFDIFIPEHKYAIEFNGWVWHKNKIAKDEEKGLLCEKYGIKVVFIYDSCSEEAIPIHFPYKVFSYDLGNESGHETLKNIIRDIALNDLFVDETKIDGIDWEIVKKMAFFNSRIKSTDQFVEELRTINDSIQVLGEYTKSNIGVLCKCEKCGYNWSPTPNSLLSGNGCPNCSKRLKYSERFKQGAKDIQNHLAVFNASFSKGKLTVLGDEIKEGGIQIKCNSCGREWTAKYSDLLHNHGCGCETKGINRTIIGVNDLLTVAPLLEREWDYDKNKDINIRQISARSSKKVWWKCSACGKSWEAVVSSRTGGSGCPFCAKENAKGRIKKNIKISLAEGNPAVAKEWSSRNGEITPERVSQASKYKAWWVCEKGHEWQASISNRVQNGSGCPFCSRHKVLKGYNDLKTTNPLLACEWCYELNGSKMPEQFLSGSHEKIWWKCSKCNHIWQATINDRSNNHGCPVCARKKRISVLEGKKEDL